MRWFVDVTGPENASRPERYCVEADDGDQAVAQVRALRSEAEAPSAEGSAGGTRDLEYRPTRAPDDAPLSASPLAGPAGSGMPPRSTTQRSFEAVREPEHELIKERSEDPTPQAPLTFRERWYRIAPDTSRGLVKVFIWARFHEIAASIASHGPGKLVQLAVYDHSFTDKPRALPLATLLWKDWRGEPVVKIGDASVAGRVPNVRVISASDGGEVTAAGAVPPASERSPDSMTVVPAPTLEHPPESVPVPSYPLIELSADTEAGVPSSVLRAALSDDPDGGEVTVASPDAPSPDAPSPDAPSPDTPSPDTPVTTAPSTRPLRPSSPPLGAKDEPGPSARGEVDDRMTEPAIDPFRASRGPSEDLIGELFDALHDLHFLPDMVAGVEFVVETLGRAIPSEVTLVHVFDINLRDFVIVRAKGPGAEALVLHRTPDRDPYFQAAMRRSVATRVDDARSDTRYQSGRWKHVACTPTAALFAPVTLGGRFLGAIELLNPIGGGAFFESEAHALEYIAGQLADFLASRPLVLERDVVLGQG